MIMHGGVQIVVDIDIDIYLYCNAKFPMNS